MKKDQVNEALISLTKSAFSAVPFAGGMLNEIAFDYRSRLKQNRLNHFIQLLSEFFTSQSDFDVDSLKTEEFSDLFESVVRRVLQTKSKEKHARFRDVLAEQAFHPNAEIDSAELYLDLIGSLDELAIRILCAHRVFLRAYDEIDPKRKKILDQLEKIGREVNDLRRDSSKNKAAINRLLASIKKNEEIKEAYDADLLRLQKFRDADFYQLSESEYLYYKQTLYSKGLLIDKGLGTYDSRSFYYMWITEFGLKFLEFITGNRHDSAG